MVAPGTQPHAGPRLAWAGFGSGLPRVSAVDCHGDSTHFESVDTRDLDAVPQPP